MAYAVTTDLEEQMIALIRQYPSNEIAEFLEKLVKLIKAEFDKVEAG